MLHRKRPRVANKIIEAIARALFENEETKALEEEVKDDNAIAKMVQEEALTKTVMSLPGFNEEALCDALSWLADHEIQQWMFLRNGIMAHRQWVGNWLSTHFSGP